MFNPRSTVVRKLSSKLPDGAVIAEAAGVLRAGGLVAFPTETVYGLGANALDAAAVQSIFDAKGRAANNPIIVHVADVAAAKSLVADWSAVADELAERFWPWPLTLVLPKQPIVPDIVSAGGSTVGIRVPAHPVALALLKSARLPIAAPSANRSNNISPTTAEHVLQGLDGRVDLILDAGPCSGGLESTVLDLTTDPPRVLRPGLVTVEQLKEVLGNVAGPERPDGKAEKAVPLRSPGMLDRHYAPRAKLICVSRPDDSQVVQAQAAGKRIGWLSMSDRIPSNPSDIVISMPESPVAYSARLYAALHELDNAEVEMIFVESPPTGDAWLAIHDRLRRASASG
jgi:L-threonylcarbamoyladenylate synthase